MTEDWNKPGKAVSEWVDKPAAISGTFSDFKLIKTRSVAQLIIEIPIEKALPTVQALGGLPFPGKEIWVAVAQLVSQPEDTKPIESHETENIEHKTDTRPKKAWHELLPKTQAGIRSNDIYFQQWVWKQAPNEWKAGRYDCEWLFIGKTWICEQCGVTSRSEITPGSKAAEIWAALDRRYMVETGRTAEEYG